MTDLPHHIEAEQAVLGVLLNAGPEAMAEALPLLPESGAFYEQKNEAVWQAMVELWQAEGDAGLVPVRNHITRTDRLNTIGGSDYLVELTQAAVSTGRLTMQCEAVRNAYIARQAVLAVRQIDHDFDRTGGNALDVLDESITRLQGLAGLSTQGDVVRIQDRLPHVIDQIQSYQSGEFYQRATRFGIDDLDAVLFGLFPGRLYIVGGHPGRGKTQLATQIARHVTQTLNQPCFISSLEMVADELFERVVVSSTAIIDDRGTHSLDSQRVKEPGALSETDFDAIVKAQTKIGTSASLFVDDNAGTTIAALKAKALRLKAKHNIRLLIVDYLQIMEVKNREDNRERDVNWLASSLKKLAKDLELPVLALSQFSRASQQRSDKTPVLSDLRESGGIEQNADVVLLLHNPEDGDAKIIIAKNRHGRTGKFDMTFRNGQWLPRTNIPEPQGKEWIR